MGRHDHARAVSVALGPSIADAKMSVGPGQGSDPGKMVGRHSCLGGAAMAASKPNKYEGPDRPAPRVAITPGLPPRGAWTCPVAEISYNPPLRSLRLEAEREAVGEPAVGRRARLSVSSLSWVTCLGLSRVH